MTTGQLIKAARKKSGMTQVELARKLNIPFQSVSQWERDIRNPKLETLQRIAAALGVAWTDLCTEDQQAAIVTDYYVNYEEPVTIERMIEIFSEFGSTLKRIRDASPEKLEKAGFLLSEVDMDIEKAENWVECLTSILILGGFSKEGAEKVVDYAADIFPRYQAWQASQPSSASSKDTDTTSPADGSEEPPKGK